MPEKMRPTTEHKSYSDSFSGFTRDYSLYHRSPTEIPDSTSLSNNHDIDARTIGGGVNCFSWRDQVNARTRSSLVATSQDMTAKTLMLRHVVSAVGAKVHHPSYRSFCL